eukprot:1160606-Pelagomonas_calceolata.AAC.3
MQEHGGCLDQSVEQPEQCNAEKCSKKGLAGCKARLELLLICNHMYGEAVRGHRSAFVQSPSTLLVPCAGVLFLHVLANKHTIGRGQEPA